MYHDRRKALPWVGGSEGIRTSDHWGVHPKPNQLSYPLGLMRFIRIRQGSWRQ